MRADAALAVLFRADTTTRRNKTARLEQKKGNSLIDLEAES